MIASFFLLFFSKTFAEVPTKNFRQKVVPPPLEEKYTVENPESSGQLATYFRENNCIAILKYFSDKNIFLLAPLEIAIYAYCEPPGKDPEKMLKYAEEKDAGDDTILLLHGRYREKKYMLNSEEIWKRLAKQAKTESLRALALQYLENGADGVEDQNAEEKKTSIVGQVGVLNESNPEGLSDSDSTLSHASSAGILFGVSSAPRIDYEFGFIDWLGTLSGTKYDTASGADQVATDLAPLVALQNSESQYFLFRPMASFLSLDHRMFYSSAGGSLGEMWQYAESEYQILVSIYADKFYQDEVVMMGGTHYKIEEKSSFRLGSNILSVALFWEKTNASQDVLSANEIIPYTNHTSTISIGYQWNGDRVSAGINGTLGYRQDELLTQYYDASNTKVISKKRYDVNSNIEPWLSWKFQKEYTVLLYYTANWVRSNMSQFDLIDRNTKDVAAGLILKTAF